MPKLTRPLPVSCAGLALVTLFSLACDSRTRAPVEADCGVVREESTKMCKGIVEAIAANDISGLLANASASGELFADLCPPEIQDGEGCKQVFYRSPAALADKVTAAGGLHAAFAIGGEPIKINIKDVPGPKPRLRACAVDQAGKNRLCVNADNERISSLTHWAASLDPDADADGIDFVDDQCPDAAEGFNGFKDLDGCPDTGGALLTIQRLTPNTIEIRTTPSFDGAELTKDGARVVETIHAAARTFAAKELTLNCVCAEGDATCKSTCTQQLGVITAALKEQGEETVYAEVVSGEAAGGAPTITTRLDL
ncbi:MAG: hypothetical protein H6713_00980 [Myxococcales bacterium]|nr:hypothetical protein [Myxococcales bacterium]